MWTSQSISFSIGVLQKYDTRCSLVPCRMTFFFGSECYQVFVSSHHEVIAPDPHHPPDLLEL
jgi:hypothetical protein